MKEHRLDRHFLVFLEDSLANIEKKLTMRYPDHENFRFEIKWDNVSQFYVDIFATLK